MPAHPSTPAERLPWISTLLAQEGEYGIVTAISRVSGASRPTLYTWRERGRTALLAASGLRSSPAVSASIPSSRAILTLLVTGHASYRGIQTCLQEVHGMTVSLGTIAAVVAEAGDRAQRVLARPGPVGPVALALDELFGHHPQTAILSAVDVHSGVVWGVAGPVVADTDSWTLLLWELAAQGLDWTTVVHDGGNAAASACGLVTPACPRQRDVWHVLHQCAQVQAQFDRQVAVAETRWMAAERYQATVETGSRPRHRPPRPLPETVTTLTAAEQGAADLRYLTTELHRLLDVVVLARDQLLDATVRRAEVETVLALLAECAATVPAPLHAAVDRLQRHLRTALPALLAFAQTLDPIQQAATTSLGPTGLGLVAWAWQRRAVLDPTGETLLTHLPLTWRPAAGQVLTAWTTAVRVSSAVESWFSLLRPHLAVHRTLSPQLLALLAVAHNHRVVARGPYAGTSPLQRSGAADASPDWLTALGYPPDPAVPSLAPLLCVPEVPMAA